MDSILGDVGGILEVSLFLFGFFLFPFSEINFVTCHQSKKEEIDLIIGQAKGVEDATKEIDDFK